MKKRIAFCLLLMLILPIIGVFNVKFNDNSTSNAINKTQLIVPKHTSELNFNYPKKVAKYSGTFNNYKTQGFEWTKDTGYWWDTSWEYRRNITISSSIAISDWPITVRISFNPPAYKYSIRVVDELGNEIPSQLSDIEYVNATHIASANVSFLVSFSSAGTKTYSVYWRTKYTDPPTYTKKLTVVTESTESGTKYTITSPKGWSIEFSPEYGGLPSNISIGDTKIGEDPKVHFGISLNGSTAYNDFLGEAYITESEWYGIPEYNDPLIYGYYLGVIFVPYKIINAKVYKGTDLIAKVNITYKIYDFGILVEEKVKFCISLSNTEIYTSGWIFDQDRDNSYNFDMIYTSEGVFDISVGEYPEITNSLTKAWNSYGSYTERIYMNGKPSIVAVKVHLTAGQHQIYVDYSSYDEADDVVLRIVDADGNYISFSSGSAGYGGLGDSNYLVYSYSTYVSGTVNIPVDGYYTIFLEGFDEDSPNIDGKTRFDIEIDDSSIATVEVFNADTGADSGRDPSVDGSTYPRESVKLLDFYVPLELVNTYHEAKLEWSNSQANLDIMIVDPFGNPVGYNLSDIGTEARVAFTPTTSGHYTAIIHYYEGSGEVPFTLTIYALKGPRFEDYDNSGDWTYIAFYHSSLPLGIGLVKLYEDTNTIWSSRAYIYHNEGDDSDDDYIYWARYFSGVSTKIGDYILEDYGIIIWQPSGTGSERYSEFDTYRQYLQFQPTVDAVASTERFNISLTVKLVDYYDVEIVGANVTIYNGTSIIAKGVTDSNGEAKFDLIRYAYDIKVSIPLLNRTYTITVSADYSTYNYTVHANTTTIKSDIITHLLIHVESATTPPYDVQNAEVFLDNGTWILGGHTNLTGWLVAYIPLGTWTLMVNATVIESPDEMDTISVYYSNNSAVGSPPYKSVSINLYDDQKFYVIDEQITTKKTATELYLVNTPYSMEETWSRNVSVIVGLREKENNTDINGTIRWYVKDRDGNIIIKGSGSVTETELYTFTFNTSYLRADETYLITIEGAPQDESLFLLPTPLTITLKVNPKPTTLFVYYEPSNTIYWNDSLTIKIKYLSETHVIRDAYISIILQKEASVISFSNLPMIGDFYVLTIDNFNYSTGTYTIKVRAEKQNYTTAEVIYQINILERKTIVYAPGIISTYWKESESILISYVDTSGEEEKSISGAQVVATLKDAYTDEIIAPVNVEEVQNNYKLTINLKKIDLAEGDYYIEVQLGKKYYENKTITIGFNVYERRTHLTLSSTGISAYYGDEVTVKVFYYDDEEENKLIPNSDIHYAIITLEGAEKGFKVTLTDLGNGTYIFKLNTSQLELGTYVFTVFLDKKHYREATAFGTIKVNAIPTSYYVSPLSRIEAVWGSVVQYRLFYVNLKEGGVPISDANVSLTMFDEAGNKIALTEDLYNLTVSDDGSYILSINTALLDSNVTYRILVKFSKEYYVEQSFDLYLTVKQLAVNVDVKTDTQVYKNPVTGAAQTKVQITLKDGSGVPVSGADVYVEVYLNNTRLLRVKAEEVYPGVYEAIIDWSRLEAGYYYTIKIVIEKAQKDGVIIPAQHISYPETEVSVYVDYPFGGSIRLFGRNLPVIIVLPLVIIGASGLGFVFYKYYTWMKLPPEVKELIRLIKSIKKGVFEYTAPTREETFKEMLIDALKIKKR